VQKYCQACKLNSADAMDHSRWRKEIKEVDDQDRCEWVNVSFGTGLPGNLGQNPESRKMVVVVVWSKNRIINY